MRPQLDQKIKMKTEKNKKKKNVMRLGGGGLSLEAFANAKTRSDHYNPALIKKQREFYKNAKYVSKYKKSLKRQSERNDPEPSRPWENEEEAGEKNQKNNKGKKKGGKGLNELYEKNREEQDKARMEREAIILAQKEERERAESRRKALKGKMLKKTKFGQPVMKYRIEHLLETIQGSTS